MTAPCCLWLPPSLSVWTACGLLKKRKLFFLLTKSLRLSSPFAAAETLPQISGGSPQRLLFSGFLLLLCCCLVGWEAGLVWGQRWVSLRSSDLINTAAAHQWSHTINKTRCGWGRGFLRQNQSGTSKHKNSESSSAATAHKSTKLRMHSSKQVKDK